MEICRKAVSIAPLKSGAVIRLDHAVMYLYFMTDRIVRMRVCFEKKEETSWETLRNNLPTLLGVSLSGQPNTGCDIGGFAGPAPEEELFVRWVQHGIFQPRFSIHSASSDNTVTEPWMYSGSCERIRSAMLLRYRMLPHLYSLEKEAHDTGAPIMRPLVYEFQEDPNVYGIDDTFLFGRDLLVANVLEKGEKTRRVYLPAGTSWYDLEDHFACYDGGQTIGISVDMDSIPRFVRSGTILPMAGNQIYHMESDPVTSLDLLLIPPKGKEAVSEYCLYDDDGKTNAFEKGMYRKTGIRLFGSDVVTAEFHTQGQYDNSLERMRITMVNKEKCPYWVMLSGKKLAHFLNRDQYEQADSGWYYSQTNRAVEIRFGYPAGDFTVQVSFEEFDLYEMSGPASK